jgi:hypothetical protein
MQREYYPGKYKELSVRSINISPATLLSQVECHYIPQGNASYALRTGKTPLLNLFTG